MSASPCQSKCLESQSDTDFGRKFARQLFLALASSKFGLVCGVLAGLKRLCDARPVCFEFRDLVLQRLDTESSVSCVVDLLRLDKPFDAI